MIPGPPTHECNVRAFGASGDGAADDTAAIQRAIDHCASSGGGLVVVPPGLYAVGPLQLRSGIDLRIAPGATLKASTRIDDYFETDDSFESPRVGLIVARDVTDVALSGGGTIDCSGMAFMQAGTRHMGRTGDFDRAATRQRERYMAPVEGREDGPIIPLDRPGNALQFIGASDVTLQGIRIIDSPNWTVNFVQCRRVAVTGLRIHNNPLVPNSDGIHLTGSEDVRITGCAIRGGDDAVAITSLPTGAIPRPGPTRRVLVADCTLASRSAGVRVGYGLDDIEDCAFANLTIEANRGIGVFARYAGSVRNVTFRNLVIATRLHTGHWWGHGEPIHLSALPGPDGEGLGVIEGVSFSGVVARSGSGLVVYGRPAERIRDLVFEDLALTLERGDLSEAYGGNLDLRPAADLALAIHEHPDYAIFVRGAARAALRNVCVRVPTRPPDSYGGALYVMESPGFRCDGFGVGA